MDKHAGETEQKNPLTAVPIEITVSIGRAHLPVKELLALEKGALVRLSKRLDDTVEVFVSGKMIAEGVLEVIEVDGEHTLGVRISDVVALSGGQQ